MNSECYERFGQVQKIIHKNTPCLVASLIVLAIVHANDETANIPIPLDTMIIALDLYLFRSHKSLEMIIRVNQDGNFLHTADSLNVDHTIMRLFIVQKEHARQCIISSLKADREIVLIAVQQNGNALQYAHNSMKNDREIVLAAVRQNRNALRYAHYSLKEDLEIMCEARKHTFNESCV